MFDITRSEKSGLVFKAGTYYIHVTVLADGEMHTYSGKWEFKHVLGTPL
ncbi:hypothetical protein L21SP4_00141 [Kiritimatiella glycovorans]|uniref:Uncharacterized protein n=1 Tax=Kiritimatiella glycovorans TaxID=1307763 RepID=A0A0G3EAG0_9BACT|nr:hypothetical protein L21SP4_00141 [Kiritimatiella glycovorans]